MAERNSVGKLRTPPRGSADLRDWQGILCPKVPPMSDDWRAIFVQARVALENRETHYPRMIEFGKISADAAEAQLEIWGLIVADWRWIVEGEGEPAPRARWPEIRAQIETSLRSLVDVARETGRLDPLDTNVSDQAHRLIAMLWHYECPPGAGRAHACAPFNHQRRAERAAAQKVAA